MDEKTLRAACFGLVPLFFRITHLLRLPALPVTTRTHLWISLPLASAKAPMDLAGVIIGLGFVLSFSYWGTDFVLIQRTLAALVVSTWRPTPAAQTRPVIVFRLAEAISGEGAWKLLLLSALLLATCATLNFIWR